MYKDSVCTPGQAGALLRLNIIQLGPQLARMRTYQPRVPAHRLEVREAPISLSLEPWLARLASPTEDHAPFPCARVCRYARPGPDLARTVGWKICALFNFATLARLGAI